MAAKCGWCGGSGVEPEKPRLGMHAATVVGLVLAFIDMAKEVEPPAGTSPRQALLTFATMCEVAATEYYGRDVWNEAVAAIHAQAVREGMRED